MSPRTRISAATERPDSSRKIRPTRAASMTARASTSPPSATTTGLVGETGERAHLDRPADRLAHLRRPAERGVEVFRVDHVEAGEVFLRLRERAVGGERLAAGDPDHGRRLGSMQAGGEDPRPALAHLLLDRRQPLVRLAHLLVAHRLALFALDRVSRQQVPGHDPPRCPRRALPALTRLRTGFAEMDTPVSDNG